MCPSWEGVPDRSVLLLSLITFSTMDKFLNNRSYPLVSSTLTPFLLMTGKVLDRILWFWKYVLEVINITALGSLGKY